MLYIFKNKSLEFIHSFEFAAPLFPFNCGNSSLALCLPAYEHVSNPCPRSYVNLILLTQSFLKRILNHLKEITPQNLRIYKEVSRKKFMTLRCHMPF